MEIQILKGFYVKDSGGYMQLVKYEGQYYVGWEIADAIESDKFDYAYDVYPTLEEALEKFNELKDAEMAWR